MNKIIIWEEGGGGRGEGDRNGKKGKEGDEEERNMERWCC